jgi:glycosyltransferase involved in cell wall biosynthesis
MPNIWVLSELYFPELTVPGPILTRISEGLATHANVQVICSQPTYSARGTRASKSEMRNGVAIHRVPSSTLDKDVLFYRIINFITISISIFISSLRHISKGDIVLAVTNPPLLPFLTVAACKLKKAKSILLILDVYPEVLISAGMMNRNSFLSRIGFSMTRSLYRACDSLVVLGRDMHSLAARKLGQSTEKIKIIPNWADSDFIVPSDRDHNHMLCSLRLTNRFVVQYSGNMGRTHGLEDLYQTAKLLEQHPSIQFLFIGSGAKKRWLENKIKNGEVRNSTVLPPSPKDELPDSLNACDIAVIAYTTGMSGVSVPSRMYNVMAAGKPIIAVADSDSELALVVTEEEAGWVVPPGNPEMIVDRILYARDHPDECRRRGLNGRASAEKKYRFKQVLSAYEHLIEEVGCQ